MRLYLIALFSLVGLACAMALPAQLPAVSTPASDDSAPATNPSPSAPTQSLPTPVEAVVSSTQVDATAAVSATTIAATVVPQEVITLPISVYILDDEDGQLSSARTIEQLAGVYEKVNDIWAPAGIVIAVNTITRTAVSPAHLRAIAAHDFRAFFTAAGRDFAVPEPSLLNGFYARDIGGPNGITPFGTRVFLVTDFPSVHHERVTVHEIGHILGLHHTLEDTDRLMYPGTNGMVLTEEEITVARYVARGLLEGVR